MAIMAIVIKYNVAGGYLTGLCQGVTLSNYTMEEIGIKGAYWEKGEE